MKTDRATIAPIAPAPTRDPLAPRFSTIRGDVVITYRDGTQFRSRMGGKWERMAGVQAVKESAP